MPYRDHLAYTGSGVRGLDQTQTRTVTWLNSIEARCRTSEFSRLFLNVCVLKLDPPKALLTSSTSWSSPPVERQRLPAHPSSSDCLCRNVEESPDQCEDTTSWKISSRLNFWIGHRSIASELNLRDPWILHTRGLGMCWLQKHCRLRLKTEHDHVDVSPRPQSTARVTS